MIGNIAVVSICLLASKMQLLIAQVARGAKSEIEPLEQCARAYDLAIKQFLLHIERYPVPQVGSLRVGPTACSDPSLEALGTIRNTVKTMLAKDTGAKIISLIEGQQQDGSSANEFRRLAKNLRETVSFMAGVADNTRV